MSSTDERLKEVIDALNHSPAKTSRPDFYRVVKKESQKTESLIDKENAGIIKMRQTWSTCILLLIVTIVLFDILLVAFYGLGIWNFAEPLVVIAVITDNFLKIVGLGFLITHSIFKKIF